MLVVGAAGLHAPGSVSHALGHRSCLLSPGKELEAGECLSCLRKSRKHPLPRVRVKVCASHPHSGRVSQPGTSVSLGVYTVTGVPSAESEAFSLSSALLFSSALLPKDRFSVQDKSLSSPEAVWC